MNEGGGYTFLLTDHLGSVNVTLAADGTIGSRLRYDPWGKQRYAQNVTPTGYRYTAQRFDDKLGLYDYNARYYDPAIGRFISADTIVPGTSRLTPLTVGFHETMFLGQANSENRQLMYFGASILWPSSLVRQFGLPRGPIAPQSLNRYAYVLNNPLIYIDPTGHSAEFPFTGTLTPIDPADANGETDWFWFSFSGDGIDISFRIHKTDPHFDALFQGIQSLNQHRDSYEKARASWSVSETVYKITMAFAVVSLFLAVVGLLVAIGTIVVAGGIVAVITAGGLAAVLTVVGLIVAVVSLIVAGLSYWASGYYGQDAMDSASLAIGTAIMNVNNTVWGGSTFRGLWELSDLTYRGCNRSPVTCSLRPYP